MVKLGEIKTLRDAVNANRMIWFFCLACGHAVRTDPWEIALRRGGDLSFEVMGKKARCDRCRHLGAVVHAANMPRSNDPRTPGHKL